MRTKIHANNNALGNPVRRSATPVQENDIVYVCELIEVFEADATASDKGYNVNHLHDKITKQSSEIVILPKPNRKVQGP